MPEEFRTIRAHAKVVERLDAYIKRLLRGVNERAYLSRSDALDLALEAAEADLDRKAAEAARAEARAARRTAGKANEEGKAHG